MYSTTSFLKQNNPNCKCRIYSIIRRSARVFESKTFAYIVYKNGAVVSFTIVHCTESNVDSQEEYECNTGI